MIGMASRVAACRTSHRRSLEMTRAELEHQLQAEGLDINHLTGTGKNGAR